MSRHSFILKINKCQVFLELGVSPHRLRQRELAQNQPPYFNNFNSKEGDLNTKNFDHITSATKVSRKRPRTKLKSVVIIIAQNRNP